MSDRIDIVVTESGAQQAGANIKGVATSSKEAAESVNLLKVAFEAYLTLETARKFVEFADAGTKVTNVLKLATAEGGNFEQAFSKVYDIAIKTGSSAESLAELFQGLTIAGKEYRVSQTDALAITQTLAEAFALSGSNATESAGAITALSRSLLAGTASARTFITIFNQSPELAKALAASFHESVSAMVSDINAGKITSEAFFGALKKAGPEIALQFSETNRTIGQSFASMEAAIEKIFAVVGQKSGAFSHLANIMIDLAQAADVAGPGLGFIAQALVLLAEGPIALAVIGLNAFVQAEFLLGAVSLDTATRMAELTNNLAIHIQTQGAALGASIGLTSAMNDNRLAAEKLKEDHDRLTASMGGTTAGLNKEADAAKNVKDEFVQFGFEVADAHNNIIPMYEELSNVAGMMTRVSASTDQATSSFDSDGRSVNALASDYHGLAGALDSVSASADSASSSLSTTSRSAEPGNGGYSGGGELFSGSSGGHPDGVVSASPDGIISDNLTGQVIMDFAPEPNVYGDGFVGTDPRKMFEWARLNGWIIDDYRPSIPIGLGVWLGPSMTAHKAPEGSVIGGDGFGQQLNQWLEDQYKGYNGGSLPGFMDGGSFVVGGVGGPDSQLVQFKASPDETVTISKPGQGGGRMGQRPVIVHFQVNARDAASFNQRATQRQILQNMNEALRVVDMSR